MMNLKNTFLAIVAATVFLVASGTAAFAEEEAPSANLSVSFLSKYVWRGYELSKDSLVIQPSVTVAYKGFGINIWGNLDTDQDTSLYGVDGAKWNETDLTLCYDNSFDMVNYGFGYYYSGLDYAPDTQELFAYAGLNTILYPTLTINRDFDEYKKWYFELSIGHSFLLTETISLNLGGHVSYMMVDDADTIPDPNDEKSAYSDFHDGLISISLSIPIAEYFTMTPELFYSFALGSDASDVIQYASADGDDNFIYGGITLCMVF